MKDWGRCLLKEMVVLPCGRDGGTTDEEGGSCYGKEKRFSEVLGERTKRRGVWLVIPLDVKEMELLVGKTPGGSLLCSWCWLISEGRSLHLKV